MIFGKRRTCRSSENSSFPCSEDWAFHFIEIFIFCPLMYIALTNSFISYATKENCIYDKIMYFSSKLWYNLCHSQRAESIRVKYIIEISSIQALFVDYKASFHSQICTLHNNFRRIMQVGYPSVNYGIILNANNPEF